MKLLSLFLLLPALLLAAPFVTVDSAVDSRVDGTDIIADRDGDGLDSSLGGSGGDVPAGAISMRVDETNYLANPGATELYEQYLWGQYPSGETGDTSHKDNGTLSFNVSDYVDGPQSLQLDMQQSPNGDNGAPYLQWYTYHNSSGGWLYTREMLNTAYSESGWQLDTYNRLRFHVKPEAGSITHVVGNNSMTNMTVGTYYASVAAGGPRSNAENGGGHPYHRFNLRPGVWNQCLLDHHPNYLRGGDPNTDPGNMQYPDPDDAPNGTDGNTYNYFDLLTRMYWDVEETQTTMADPVYLWDQFYFYEETNVEEEEQVYSLCGSYDSATNTLGLDWRRHISSSTSHEVRYAFSDIHALGWDNATPAPNGSSITPPGGGAYNGMYYTTTGIDVSGQSEIYFAVRRVGDTMFKQIRVDLGL